MTFIGKWTFGQGSNAVQIDMNTGVLKLGALPSDGTANFNAYGTAADFILQGPNGCFIVSSNSGYAATLQTTDGCNHFTLVSTGTTQVRMADLGNTGGATPQFYWNASGNTLSALAVTASPPATTLFDQTIVTPSLTILLSAGFTSPQPDLRWVDLSGTDFTNASGRLDFTNSLLAHANLSNTKFLEGMSFDKSTAPYVNFAGAGLSNCSIGSMDCTGADFTNARLAGISAEWTNFSNAKLNGARFASALNLAHAKFVGAVARNANFSNVGNIIDTDFSDADLTGVVFTGSFITGVMNISGANLTGAALNNDPNNVTIFPNMIVINSATNCTGANFQYIDFSKYNLDSIIFTGANLTGCTFHGATMKGADLSYATMDYAKFTGTVLLNGANLSNASLKNADMTNAQFGALSSLFSVGTEPSYTQFLTALRNGDTAVIQKIFAANGYAISGAITITLSRFTSTDWTVQAPAPTPQTFVVSQQTISGATAVVVYSPTAPALLSNAFMVNVNLTGANLIGVNAAGAAIYGVGGAKPNLNSALLQDGQFSNTNLGNADFSSANLGGVSFDNAVLSNATFQNAKLSVSGSGTRASFVGANLQSANFDGAAITNVAFTNAAVAIANPVSPSLSAGVWLFSIPSTAQPLILGELQAAAVQQFTLPNTALSQLQRPGTVGTGIVQSFAKKGITLTSDAVLAIMGSGIYWQLVDGQTQSVIFQSFDTSNYRAALGVANGSAYTTQAQYFLPASLQANLKNGPVNAQVVAAFADAGHPISSNALISAAQYPCDWQIINGAPSYDVYSLWLGVVPPNGLTITTRPAIPNLIAAFNGASIALSSRATVALARKGNGWAVDNDAENPYNPVVNYISFNMFQSDQNSPVDVYGSHMRITRQSALGQLEYYNMAVGITTLTQAQLFDGNNVCPDGDFATTDQHNGLPFPQWLRARVTPRPPRCIPDPSGMSYCPL